MKSDYESSFIQTTFSVLLFAILCTTAYSNAFLGNKTDYKALLAIKGKLNDDGGVLMSWNDSLHHCSWEGVTCGPKHNRVIQLYFDDRGLRGTISPFIGNLSFIRFISFTNNILSGPIPPEIGRLWRLQVLYLYNNSISGEIPSNISGCINLQELDVSRNHLQGEVPMGLGRLSNLKNLLIDSNYKLVGPLFKVIANLTSLELIYAYENAFTGNIPDSIICRMTNLTWLNLHSNKLSGTIPPSIFNLSSLQVLHLASNQLRGSIPPFISSFTLPQLQQLILSENYLSGTLPTSIQNLTTLQYIELSTNNFTGHLSINFGHLNSLQSLMLDFNSLEGDINFIITTLLNCTYLEVLDLRYNYFTGVLPKHTSNLSTTLIELTIGGDSINGQIPIGISNLINLRYLSMYKSHLTGNIPQGLGKLQKLEQLYLYSNKLTGDIPYSFGNLSHLSTVDLSRNHLQEYGMGSEVSLEADLYSFGILLLELMTRKRPTDEMFNEDLNLHMYAKAALPDQVLQIVDSSVLIDEDDNEEVDSRVPRLEERLQQREKCISFIIRIGVACSRELPSDRMKMSEAISELQKARNIIHNPRRRHNLP